VHKPFNGDPNYPPLDNWIPNDNPDINLLEVLLTTHNIGTETKYKVDVHTDVQNIYHSTNTHSHMHTVHTKVVVNNNNIKKGRFASPYLNCFIFGSFK
jgi:hypothetical protein